MGVNENACSTIEAVPAIRAAAWRCKTQPARLSNHCKNPFLRTTTGTS